MLGNLSCFCWQLLTFFKTFLSGTLYQSVETIRTQIRRNILLVPSHLHPNCLKRFLADNMSRREQVNTELMLN